MLVLMSVVFFITVTGIQAQVYISKGQTLTENFDGIGTSGVATLPIGWKVDKLLDVRTLGTYSASLSETQYRAGNNMSSTAANGIYNYAAGDPTSATDRAIGFISSSSATKSGNLYLHLENNGADTIKSFNISYNVEKYRKGTRPEGFSVQLYYSLDGTVWTNAGTDFLVSFPGSDPANEGYVSAPGDSLLVSNKILNIDIPSGYSLYLAWNYSVTSSTLTSNAQGLGIDNIVINTSNSGITESLVVTNNGSNVYDINTSFNGKDFGNFPLNGNFTLKGGQIKTWKNDPPDDITGGRMMYRIYEQSLVTLPDFDTLALPWAYDYPNPGDQLWENDTMNIDILSGLSIGDYFIEVYFESDYTSGVTPGIYTDNNSGNNYIAEFSAIAATPNSGIFERYIVTNTSSDIYTEGNSFNGSDLGLFYASDNLLLKGGQLKTWKNAPPDDITAARMFYRIYEQAATPPVFTSVNLPWKENLPNLNDQLWENITANVNVLNGLITGNYFIEFYFEADYTANSVPGIHTDNNSGNNYKAQFSFVNVTCGTDTIPFVEGFNSSTMPNCWTQVKEGGTNLNWVFVTNGNVLPASPHEGARFAYLSSPTQTDDKVKLISPKIDLSTAVMPYIKFWHYMTAWGSDQDELRLFYRTDPASPWVLLTQYTNNVSTWTERYVQLPNGTATYQIAFEGNAKRGRGIAIDYVIVDKPLANDLAIVEWVSPKSDCSLGTNEPITVKIVNFGTNPQTNVPIVATTDAGTTIIGPEFLPGTLQPGDTLTYTFTVPANLSVPGQYICAAVLLMSTDQNKYNDTLIEYVYSTSNITNYPYFETFDIFGGWSPDEITGLPQWELGLPSQLQLNSSYSGLNQNAWMTILDANYDNDVNTYLLSPCYDFSLVGLPMFSVWLNIKTENNNDAMVLEYTTDGGALWQKVTGDAGFYNNTSALGPVAPPKWSGTNGGWTKYETSLPDLSGESNVRFRFRFQSNASITDEGVAIDEIIIYEQTAIDVSVTAVINPENSVCGNLSDSVIVTVENFGYQPQDSIPVMVKILRPDNSITTISDTLFPELVYGQSMNLNVGVVNSLLSGTYTVKAYSVLTGDANQLNDTAVATFDVTLPIPTPYVQDFENGLQDWLTDMTIGNGHGNTTNVLFKNLNGTYENAYAMSPKIGLINTGDFLMFDYRIVDYSLNSPWNATNLVLGDTIRILITNDCGLTYDVLDVIDHTNHVPTNLLTTKQYDISSYVNDEIFVRFEFIRANPGDYYLDIDNFVIAGVPVVDLGADVDICEALSVTLDADNVTPFTTYEWSTINASGVIATTQTITVDSSATYYVIVDNGFGITDSDTVTVTVLPAPDVNLGPDLLMCSTDSITLDAGLEVTTFFEDGLRGSLPNGWTLNDAGGQPIEQPAAGGYMLLDNTGDWVVSETFDLTGLPNVQLWLDIASYGSGANNLMLIEVSNNNGSTWSAQFPLVTDTTIDANYITQGPFTITATGSQVKFRFKRPATSGRGVRFRDLKITTSSPYASYLWNTNDTTQTITIADAGTYGVLVTAANGCTDIDTINVSFFNVPVINFGTDTAICTGDNLVLNAGTGFTSYLWQNNSTNQTFNVTSPGTFYVLATDSNGCQSSDTISVIINPLPYVNLGPDTSICDNTSAVLDAGQGINYSYEWKVVGQTPVIATTQTLTVNQAGHYSVIVDNGCSATASDSIVVYLLPAPNVNLGQDQSICDFTTTIIDAGVFNAYLWSTGATTQTITVGTAGNYWVEVTAANNCKDKDTVNLSILTAPVVNLGADTIICVYDNLLLNAGTGFTSYLWQDNSTANTFFVQGSVMGIGTYNINVTVGNVNNCFTSDSIVVIIDPCTGINETWSNAVNIYPNPTQDVIFIEFNQAETDNYELSLVDIHGRLILSEKVINTNGTSLKALNIKDISKGIYFLKLQTEHNVSSYKIILQ